MRSDRGISLATILVVLCCFGGTVTAGSIVTHRVLVASVASSLPTVVVKSGSQYATSTSEYIGLMPYLDTILHWQDEIVDHHNLPSSHPPDRIRSPGLQRASIQMGTDEAIVPT